MTLHESRSMKAIVSWRRLRALCLKETYQILRDPSSGIVAFALPMVLLFVFGYGINLDTNRVRLGVFNDDDGFESQKFVEQLTGSPYLEVRIAHSRPELDQWLEDGIVRGYVTIASDFSRQQSTPGETAPLQLVTDGTEPNTANFTSAYVTAVWEQWQLTQAHDRGESPRLPMEVDTRYWFNAAAISRHYLIPGSITIIMTVIGALLTSLVVAREWERGTMEALLASPINRAELLLSKLLPYYILGILSMTVVTALAVFLMGVPFRGSLFLLFIITSLFLLSVLGVGLLISSVTKDQFNSAQTALNVAFLPAVMLSGFIFEIQSMPFWLRMTTYLLPPRYFVNALQTLFLAGDIYSILLPDMAFLAGTSVLFLALAARSTQRRLDG